MTRMAFDDLRFEHRDRSRLDIIQLVTTQAREECSGECCTLSASLDACVEQVVTALWPNRIRTYVPLLALREVRECIRAGTCEPRQERKADDG
jgi:hypothetical protein